MTFFWLIGFVVPGLAASVPAFDYYVFTRCWNDARSRTIVHGLWPNYRNGSWPSYCNQTMPWNYSQVTDIVPELSDRWSDTGEADPSWWQHEWEKHGTCAFGSPWIKSQSDYFATTLWLDMYLSVNGRFNQSGGLRPTPYTQKELANIFQATPICQLNGSGHYILEEIRLHVSVDFKSVEPTRDDGGCGDGQAIYLT